MMKKKYQALIAAHPVFSVLNTKELEVFSALLTEKTYMAGENIVNKGDIVDAVYFIVQGRAEVNNPDVLAVLREGENIGLNDTGFFSATGFRTATVTALTDMRVLRLDLEQLRDFLSAHPNVSQHMLDSASVLLKMRFIKKVRPFAALSSEKLQDFIQKITAVSLSAGTQLFKQGDISDNCYLIESGHICISITDAQGKTKVLAQLKSPGIFGETGLLLDTPRNADATAVENSKLWVISKALFAQIMEKESETQKAMTLLHQFRSRPRQIKTVKIFHQRTDDAQKIITLKQTVKNNYFQLSEHGWFIWGLIDGTRNLSSIVRDFYRKFHLLNARLVLEFILELHEAGFVEIEIKQQNISDMNVPFWIKFFVAAKNIMEKKYAFAGVDARIEKSYHRFFWIFYTKTAQILCLLLAVIGLGIFIFNFKHAVFLLNTSDIKWILLLSASYLMWLTIIPHELAHAYTTKFYQREVISFGLGWFWLGPMVFCDTSDMWLCPDKKSRILVDLAGVYFNFILGSVMALSGLFFWHSPAVFAFLWVFALFNYLAVFANLSPLMELDGYYALMDSLEKPNLHESAILFLVKVFDRKNAVPFWACVRQQKKEAFYWGICLIYILLESILPYFLTQHVFYNFLGKYNHPFIGIVLSVIVLIFSGAGIFAKFKQKKLLFSAQKK